ncbi:MAG TPA: PAS domain S-box protein, partial [Bauldia sp.]|nr:PAS domain S-box protein [Bauldia sp.]
MISRVSFDADVVRGATDAADVIADVLAVSTAYAVLGEALDGIIRRWNEGARIASGFSSAEIGGEMSFDTTVFTDASVARLGVFASDVTGPAEPDDEPDISARKRLQAEIKASQTHARSLLELHVDALTTIDPDGVITDVNRQMETLTGKPRADLIGTPFKSHFSDPALAEEGIRRVLRDGKVANYELSMRAGDDREVTLSFNATTFYDTEHKLQGMFVAGRDITAQKQEESRLLEQRAYLRGLIDSSPDGLAVVDLSGIITDVNDQMCKLLGVERDALVGTSPIHYVSEPDQFHVGFERLLREGSLADYMVTLVTRSGRHIPASFSGSVIRDDTGKPIGIVAAARDVTERQSLEQRLRDQEFYPRSLIESNIDALMTTDPHGIITDVNQQMEALTGLSRADLIGTPFKAYFTDPARAEEGIRLVLREGKITDYELTARSKAGHETVVSYNAATFADRDGKLQGVFAAAREITERRRFEEALKEKNVELEEANLARDRFLAGISHELRTPLNAIIGFTGTLLMRLPGEINEEQEKQLDTVRANAKHLLLLINDLLDLAKIDSGDVDLTREPIMCQALVREIAAWLAPLAKAKGLSLAIDAPEREVVVMADNRALHQIILNLASNAVKYTER